MTNMAKLMESPTDRAERLVREINADSKETYTRIEVVKLLNAVNACGRVWNALKSGETVQRGDVFLAKVTGGKTRPWICLSSSDGLITAVGMSSGDHAPKMIASQARYWSSNWIGSTVSMFREKEVREFVTLPYNNRDHLREIERAIALTMRLRS